MQIPSLCRRFDRLAAWSESSRSWCLSKQRNKHIQRVLVEAAKLAPKQNHELALVYDKAKQKGNANRATIAVARKMVTYLLAVDRGQRPFVPIENFSTAVA
jgi:transposase